MVRIPPGEIRFRTSRSGGPGGQNVNKVETRVELLFDVAGSVSLSADQKARVLAALASRVDAEGILHVASQRARSQWGNKELAIAKFISLLRGALQPRKKRVKTAPTRASHQRRMESKKRHSDKKKLRRMTSSHE